MVKVIETNLSLNELNEIIDFQSRVIEAKSWEGYVDEFKNGNSMAKNAVTGNLFGSSCPRYFTDGNLKDDNYHLNFSFRNGMGDKKKMLAYLINE